MTSDLIQFSITVGNISISGNVPNEFFESSVKPAMEDVLQRVKSGETSNAVPLSTRGPSGDSDRLDLSVKAICQRLGAKTGTDILKAGAISLALVQGQQQFTRKEILAEAQKASGYWKASISNDAGRYLTTLQSQKFLIEGASGQLSLSAKAETEMLELLNREA